MWNIPLFDTAFGDDECAAVHDVVASGWLTMGECVRAFEIRFAEYIGTRHAVAVANCTAGLHLVHAALGTGPGDQVICPSLSFAATANSVLYVGAEPVFADIGDLDHPVPTAATIAACLSPRTSAIQVMHYAGWPAPMESILALARERQIPVIEDCAHAPGAALAGRKCGAHGLAGVFSFYSNKNMTTGEGGMVTTDDDALAERLRLLRSQGMTSGTVDRHRGNAHGYDIVELGFNFRLDEMRAALGCVQLDKLGANNARRAAVARRYRQRLTGIAGLRLPFAETPGTSAYHIQPVLIDPGRDRSRVISSLRDRSIQTSIHYPPIHLLSYYRRRFGFAEGMLPLTEEAGARELTLPMFPAMTEDQVDTVCDALAAAVTDKAA